MPLDLSGSKTYRKTEFGNDLIKRTPVLMMIRFYNAILHTCYDPAVCGSYDGEKIWLDSSVGRASARYAVGPRFDSSFSHFLLLRSVVILSRWADVGCEIFPSLTHMPLNEGEGKTRTLAYINTHCTV